MIEFHNNYYRDYLSFYNALTKKEIENIKKHKIEISSEEEIDEWFRNL